MCVFVLHERTNFSVLATTINGNYRSVGSAACDWTTATVNIHISFDTLLHSQLNVMMKLWKFNEMHLSILIRPFIPFRWPLTFTFGIGPDFWTGETFYDLMQKGNWKSKQTHSMHIFFRIGVLYHFISFIWHADVVKGSNIIKSPFCSHQKVWQLLMIVDCSNNLQDYIISNRLH